MKITVNGTPEEVPQSTTLRALIEFKKLSVDKVATEVNKRLVRSANGGYERVLAEGDAIEIVTFVGGG